jgi:hypothetical protein
MQIDIAIPIPTQQFLELSNYLRSKNDRQLPPRIQGDGGQALG